MRIYPWGPLEWLLEKTDAQAWHLITSASFEERCIGVTQWLRLMKVKVNSSVLLKIENPQSDQWVDGKRIVEENFGFMRTVLSGAFHTTVETPLLAQPGQTIRLGAINPENFESVILDISTMPKRFFMFAFKQLMNSARVRDLIITYAQAREYPETALCMNALPPAALQGYGRVSSGNGDTRMIVGVGYMPLSVEELLEQAKHTKLDFLFPFPPASPAFRRNWSLLSMLMPDDIPRNTEIHRIHSMDAFEVARRVQAWGTNTCLDLIPLGPKPHALGMAMAHLRLNETAEIIYSQPQAYSPYYSKGIVRDEKDRPKVTGYYLKRKGRPLF
jgi:hypothetical protein